MNPSKLFILRPVATTLLMAAIMLSGGVAYRFLPLSALPEVDYPTIQVRTFLPGASPEVMTSAVTAPLERQLGQMPGLNEMTSESSAGASIITLQFSLNLNLDIAEQEVQASINASSNLLPATLPAPPVYSKVNPADAPIMSIAITSQTLNLIDLEDLAEQRIAQKIAQRDGVGQVEVSGGERPAVRVQINPQALAAYSLNIDDLRTTISNASVNNPKGGFDGPEKSSTILANDQLFNIEDYKETIIAYRNGAPVRLSDVAKVVRGAENEKLRAWASGVPAIILNIRRQPGANVIAVADDIKKLLPALKSSLPQAVDLTLVGDRTTTIRASVADVEFELAFAIALVVLVIFLFLRNLPATIIPSLSVPLSLVGTLNAMYLMGFSLDNLSLMALTISTGFVVDDAIVMIENISRFVEAGRSPMQAALDGSEQIGFTIISLTVSLIAVLIPLLFMGDVIGRLFHEFAITLAITIVISAFVSLTLVPMLCARLIGGSPGHQGHLEHESGGAFNTIVALYGSALKVVLRHQPMTLGVAILTLVVTIGLYYVIPKGFFPVQDTGLIQATTQASQSISFDAMAKLQQRLGDVIARDKAISSVSSFIGIDGNNATLSSGRFLISLVPHEERGESATQVIARLQKAAKEVSGIDLFMQPVQDLTIDSTVGRAQYNFILQSASLSDFKQWTPRLLDRLREAPALADVTSNTQANGQAVDLVVDRATAARFGITLASIDNVLYDSYGQRQVNTIYTQSNQYRVILEVDPTLQRELSQLSALYLPSSTSSTNGQVPLDAIIHMRERPGPLLISHLSQFPSTIISFNVARGNSLGNAVAAIQQAEADIGLPESFVTSFQGSVAAFHASMTNELLLIIAAVVTMYVVLGVLYESFIHPVTILSTLPSAGVGALLALTMSGGELNVVAIIGIILLIGIVKKNAIMMIDFALDAERNESLPPDEAIYQACLLRLRPILMTTMAAILGALPLMLGTGVGSELRHPLGISIVGGLILSQVLTLFTTPVIYLYFDRLAARLRGRSDAQSLAEESAE